MELTSKSASMLFKHPLFRVLDKASAERTLKECGCYEAEQKAGDVILSPQSTQKTVGIILSGKASVTTTDDRRSVLLRQLSQGDVFGIANLFTKEPYVSMIRAVSTCRVLYIPEEAMRRLLESDRNFYYRYLEFLSSKICFLNKKIGYLTAGSPERRLALYLASLGENPIKLPLSISALCEVLDTSRTSLYRAFDRLSEDGFLQKEGRVFHLIDSEAMLRAYH